MMIDASGVRKIMPVLRKVCRGVKPNATAAVFSSTAPYNTVHHAARNARQEFPHLTIATKQMEEGFYILICWRRTKSRGKEMSFQILDIPKLAPLAEVLRRECAVLEEGEGVVLHAHDIPVEAVRTVCARKQKEHPELAFDVKELAGHVYITIINPLDDWRS